MKISALIRFGLFAVLATPDFAQPALPSAPADPIKILVGRLDLEKYKATIKGLTQFGDRRQGTDRNRAALAAALPTFPLTLRKSRTVVDRGVGANVLGSPALALAHLARLLATQPQFQPLARGEVITTGTITDAWPIVPGEIWTSDYGALGIGGVTVEFT